ncbi:proton-conducting transporter transmembrane domain-containing protein [Haloarchaeobius litoreus]|uniref:Proton-conducting transporter membrane subunit n=1 Tax=Haloarchaeobius litoreus TaxID=755306 RepID=A0ABD6DKE2_9EURY|nr:proton-conducting transporter membrane subunit [Haloarchaeobius litoreus]
MNLLTAVPPGVVPFGLALVVPRLPRRTGTALAVVASLATAGWLLLVPAGAHVPVVLFGFDAVLFHVDPYSRLLGATFGLVAAVAVAFTVATDGDRRQVALALAYVGAGMGATLAGDWLSLVVYWELMAVAATVLVWHHTSDRRAGFRYAVYHEVGGLVLVAGVLLHYAEVGTFLFGDGVIGGLPALLVALGIGLNAGFLGLHVWLVDTYPTTHVATSVVLAAVTTKVGAYAIVRAFPDGHVALTYVGAAMVLFGVTFAILQTDVRRLLSYHIVSQVGYMVAGFGAGAGLARSGAMVHLVNNILYKSLLFMVAGVLVHRTGREGLKKLGGLGRAMPLTAGVFLVAALSISGLPGFNGFVSKGMVLDGVEATGPSLVWYALLVGGVGTVISFAKFGYYAFLHGDAGDGDAPADLAPGELATLGGVAALCVLFGVVPSLLLDVFPAAVVADAKPFSPSQFQKAGAVTAAGLVGFAALRPLLGRTPPTPDLDSVYHPAGRALQTASVGLAGAVEDATNRAGGVLQRGLSSLLAGETDAPSPPTVDRASRTIGLGVLASALVLALLLAVLVL